MANEYNSSYTGIQIDTAVGKVLNDDFSNMTSSDVTTALGYTPVDSNDIVDDLITDDDKKVLSANQGVELKGLIDGLNIPTEAAEIGYDNANSGLEADNVQDAIDEHLDNVAYNQTIHAKALRATLILYVDPTGNDTTGDGSQSKPFRQISKAISVIPKNLNGYSVTINVASGTYTGDISLQGFFGSPQWNNGITIIGGANLTEAENYIIDGKTWFINNAFTTLLKGFTVKNRIMCYQTKARLDNIISEEAITDGVDCIMSNVLIQSTRLSNKYHSAIRSLCSTVYVYDISGSGNNIGYMAGEGNMGQGGIIIKTGNNTLTATTLDSKFGGSQIW